MPHQKARRGAARRIAVPAMLVALLAAACSSGQSDSEVAETASSTRPATMASGQCMSSPALPTEIPTFTPEDAPADAPAGTYAATLRTTCGDIEVELYADESPATVGSFMFLAESGYWNDSPCHRLTTSGIYVLQCGDPTGTGRGGPGYTFGVEAYPPDGRYPVGSLAMARRGADLNSNGGQFFIVYDDSTLPVAAGGYTLFGRVVSGMDIVDRVAEQGVDGGGPEGMPAQRISILNVDVNEEAASE